MIRKLLVISTLSISLLLGACGQDKKSEGEFLTDFDGVLKHVHGIGYISGEDLTFATHDGLKVYKDKKWFSTTEQNHDYMGFNAVDNGFYTSGHPSKGSKLSNPLGIQKSTDKGKSLSHVAFEGDLDFHTMAVGYQNHAIYVYMDNGNSQLSTGLHRSLDEGKSWTSVKGEGLEGDVIAIAAHPIEDKYVAVATKNGIYLSNDGGQSFATIEQNIIGTTVYFTEDKLWYSTFQRKPRLTTFNLETEAKQNISLPDLGEDAIMYFAKKSSTEEMTFYTDRNHAYRRKDDNKEWKQIVDNGRVK